MYRSITAWVAVCLLLVSCNSGDDSVSKLDEKSAVVSENVADVAPTVVYANGNIISMEAEGKTVEAAATRDGSILAVGNKSAVLEVAGVDAQVVDLQGKTMLPGLIDAHGHISFTSLTLASANLSSPPVGTSNSIDDVVAALNAFRERVPGNGWITGWGYDDSLLSEKRHPTKQDLDKVSTERPIAIRHVSGHLMSCNSKCLELAGITADTSDPAGGIIRRIAGGKEPDGVLEETAMGALHKVMPTPTESQRIALLAEAQKYYAAHGITTVQDGAAMAEEIDVLRKVAANQGLYLDVVAFPYAPYLAERIDDYKPDLNYKDHFRIGGFKLVLDGSPQGKTAWLTKPYLHAPHGQSDEYTGYATLTDDVVAGFVDKAFSEGIPLLAHANGDAAADQLIDAVASANEKFGQKDRRTVMIHAQTVREDQIDSMLEQGIIPSYFSAHTFYWGDWHRDSVFGVERASRISPLRSSADKGLRYTTHNDTPIVPPDMMRLLWASVNRVTRSGQVLGEEQRATVFEALKSITSDAAYQYFEEDIKGTISVGKKADLVILSDDPMSVDPLILKDIKVEKTIKDGVVIYQR
jgi:predicted amidohydrolase YtcJ